MPAKTGIQIILCTGCPLARGRTERTSQFSGERLLVAALDVSIDRVAIPHGAHPHPLTVTIAVCVVRVIVIVVVREAEEREIAVAEGPAVEAATATAEGAVTAEAAIEAWR